MVSRRVQGKRNRQAGARFERKVRADLESSGWIVDRWTNNVNLSDYQIIKEYKDKIGKYDICKQGKLIPAKSRFGLRTTGFPDLIAFQKHELEDVCRSQSFWNSDFTSAMFQIIGVECKSNGYVDKEEREKCRWYIKNNIFSRILIAKKGKKRGSIEYIDFIEKYGTSE